ncbi:hypothetical protein RIR_jg38834.t1 [Rhizophagus irregularis DAOM 181602=DAOM 197198]|nr:hypothetical protein RIR_jg38834.t1 [Rhizophagus irregularis DAOM 181602=DAOM 197198]
MPLVIKQHVSCCFSCRSYNDFHYGNQILLDSIYSVLLIIWACNGGYLVNRLCKLSEYCSERSKLPKSQIFNFRAGKCSSVFLALLI